MKLKDEEKHSRLIQAGITVLAQGGLANFSTTKVAKLAGIPQSNVYIYFANKQGLLEAIYQDTVHQQSVAVVTALDATTSVVTQLAASITALYHFARNHPETVAALQVLLDDPELKHQLRLKADDQANQQIQQLLQTGVAQQVLRNADLNLSRYFLARPVFHLAAGVQSGLYADTPQNLTDLTTMIMGAVLRPAAYQSWLADR
ncbi:TetR/AcrR family transcriptional regulator [Levilactobacillus yiduensis]|uniref:TetR/AcrR family transcriptional regulator n=1 Tax=Levilactobacillus yiduensis TaxID=2953880 RepID=UPI000EF2F8E5|nr:TetR/AcrR family transcriptional regulator [Levilactobacillus yiduensis]AYM04001.1 TetR/AcrR family transcriptional regulator [Levilactobacillus brevis]